jgi:DNA invertase Pin-like site-specific DNA recombinase
MSKPTITVIPATIDLNKRFGGTTDTAKRRVAAYARVSTELEEQETSFVAQVDYYTKKILSEPDWIMVEVYSDEGISATTTKRREGFNRMIADALAGKIDLILTKSISRFARNTVDTLTFVRQLKEKGVEVIFEKEGLKSFDPKTEFVLSIMASAAQEESRSLSENVTWGKRKRMSDGLVTMAYKRFLGYEKGADDKPQIVESEAVVIRQIYDLYLCGATYREIAATLMAQGILTPCGKTTWRPTTVGSILQNEKYAGMALLQKQFTVDYLTKKVRKNNGEVTQYFIENSHPAIIPQETYELVQDEIRRREKFGKQISGSGLYVGKVVCGDCGKMFGAKVWNSTTKWKSVVWRCNHKYNGETCQTPHLKEEAIQQVFVAAWNRLIARKVELISQYEADIAKLADMSGIDGQMDALKASCKQLAAMIDATVAVNATTTANQAEYIAHHDKLVAEFDAAKAELGVLESERKIRISRKARIGRFLDTFKKTDTISAFDENLWRQTVEVITVRSLDEITVRFYSGTEISVSASKRA